MSDDIRVVQYGLGAIGRAVARHIVERPGVTLVGGVDTDPAKLGRDLGDVLNLERNLGVCVQEDLGQALAIGDADVAVHCTSSYFRLMRDQIVEIVRSGLDVVSTAEELSFPWLAHPEQAAEIDAVAKDAGKTVLGTGVNPGFIMDSLPLYLTSICQRVDHISVSRLIDASARRGPFQTKIGSGMTVDEFEGKMAAGEMGHVGLTESMGMIFDTLGRELVDLDSEIEAVVASQRMQTDYVKVEVGQVKGLRQLARGYTRSGELVRLSFVAELGMQGEGDVIKIAGRPDLEMRMQGTNGDIATIAMVVNAIPRAIQAGAGLTTMRDLPLVVCW